MDFYFNIKLASSYTAGDISFQYIIISDTVNYCAEMSPDEDQMIGSLCVMAVLLSVFVFVSGKVLNWIHFLLNKITGVGEVNYIQLHVMR